MSETKKPRAADTAAVTKRAKPRGTGNRKKATASATAATPGSTFGMRTRGSITDQLEGLEVGESIARAKRFPPMDFADPSKVTKAINKFYDSHNSSFCTAVARVKRASAHKGKAFRIERGRFQTNDAATMVCITVTRME